MADNQCTLNLKSILKEFSHYFIDFFMAVLIGLGVSILFDIPMKFIKTINIDLGHFIAGFVGMCIALYVRSYRRGYDANLYTYSFQIKKVLLYVGMTFVAQILLTIIIGGHALYISGPTVSLSSFVFPAADRATVEGRFMLASYDWLFMILADILIYAPIIILGEYLGYKQNRKGSAESKNV